MQHKQITIVGGGPIGLSCALLLAKSGIGVTVLDDGTAKQNEGRVRALSYASIAMLKDLKVWPDNRATPIQRVHISHSGLGISNILANDVNLPCLGYTIKYTDIYNSLDFAANKCPNITRQKCSATQVIPGVNFATIEYNEGSVTNYLTSDLVIMAEGGKIKINDIEYKEHDYAKCAITAEISASKKHQNIAYERFDSNGASVFLPHGDNFVLVWSLPKDEAKEIIQQNNLIEKLAQLPFMKRFGKIELAGKVFSFPLKLQVAKTRVLDRIVLIGNSAQTLHPISAQGMNLALRDASLLAEMIIGGKLDPQQSMENYDRLRRKDARTVIGFTHALARFLEHDNVNHLRGAGIIALSNCKPLQNVIANSLIFGN